MTVGLGLIMAAGVCATLPRLRSLQRMRKAFPYQPVLRLRWLQLSSSSFAARLEAPPATALFGGALLSAVNWYFVARR